MFSWSVLGGYDYSIRQFTVGPRVGLNYARTLINGYTEQGSTGLELMYQDQFIESFQSVLGVQATAPVSWRYGVLVPQINADYIHEFANSQRLINVQFAQDGRNPAWEITIHLDAQSNLHKHLLVLLSRMMCRPETGSIWEQDLSPSSRMAINRL